MLLMDCLLYYDQTMDCGIMDINVEKLRSIKMERQAKYIIISN